MTIREIRKRFLTHFFEMLEANGVRYCMLRNYDDLYGNAATDLDIIVSEYSLKCFEQCLRTSAHEMDFHFVHAARYVNFSWVFWNPLAGFIRVDYETDIRWRLFTVLEAREVLDRRRRHQEFFIPHPEHEIAILLVAALWRGELTERYRRQLGDLYAACPETETLCESLICFFGQAGHALTDFKELPVTSDRRFFTWLRLSLALRTHLIWPRFPGVLRNLRIDAARFLDRLVNAAGVSLVFVSSNPVPPDFSELQRKIEFLFPIQKGCLQEIDWRGKTGVPVRITWRERWRRWRTLFKGGLFVRAYRVTQDGDWTAILRPRLQPMYPERSFVCVEDARGEFYFAHVQSGIMNRRAPQPNAECPKDFSRLFIEFISHVLEREQRFKRQASPRPGKFCVLVGLDGAGKTTLARNLAGLGMQECLLAGVRYFHWLPGWRKAFTCPWPEPGNQPRKPRLPAGNIQSLLSVARLLRNLLRAQFAWWWRLRPMRNHGYLLLVDRYFYNYYLDPVSVKYYGPRWVLDRLSRWFPKPDIVITLSAPPEVLWQRKQELSEAEMRAQAAALQQLKFPTPHVIAADASEPAHVVADKVMAQLRKLMS